MLYYSIVHVSKLLNNGINENCMLDEFVVTCIYGLLVALFGVISVKPSHHHHITTLHVF